MAPKQIEQMTTLEGEKKIVLGMEKRNLLSDKQAKVIDSVARDEQ